MKFRIKSTEIEVNLPDAAALLAEVGQRFEAGTGFALATINLDHLVKLRSSEVFADAYAAQDLVVADGNPIVWLGRLAGRDLSLVPGSDMVLPLARLAAEKGVKVGLVGSTEQSLARAGDEMQRLVPGLEVAAKIAPPMGFDPQGPGAEQVFAGLEAAGVGLVFLALGAPKQEILAARGREQLAGIGFASIGAGLDFLSGAQKRAPKWVRAIAMEWAWRMLSAPGRLVPRYARCFAILPGHMWRSLKMRSTR
ncbi:WecB/TagA/CpsF family glycosyltransferase [Alisedimentitalea sp. MJ-SS2]|uniref:WecB/TagA/CpsF family glycosyltransferase n=1 Tax=Aliisedimentitalea sp. MJ-SS2 TaxID=3049795 RepID=UPI00290F352E|nr:WecB/TagA/CpsF family glycosyltransferase [Alisedimentitalea sp. MJ-SS2]MDU8926234.1 WecB/TagA/CpsF family glycosyltransferase [Alisedimentitalea sp. MJ-SS2]